MKLTHVLALAVTLSFPALSANAAAPKQKPVMQQQHMAQMDAHMRVMRDMHQKMMNAKTQEERNALMDEHMRTMQKSMAMMNQMGPARGDSYRMSPQGMQKQMEMMQMTMQMMLDRMKAMHPEMTKSQ